jgi:hypothetical protein
MGDRRLTPKSEAIERFLYVVRGERVLFDADLAALYGVSTSALNQAVKRNRNRFPADFMFRMKEREWSALKSWIAKAQSSGSMMSQVVTSSRRKRTAAPYAFTEQGVAIARKIEAMERKYDEKFLVVFDAIKRLIADDNARKASPSRRIGFIS